MTTTATSTLGGEVTTEAPAESAPAENIDSQSTEAIIAPEWANGMELEQDLLGDPSLKAIKDVPSLVKSYVHSQRKMGSDKTVLPNKNSTPEEWSEFYTKMGLPTEFEQYNYDKPENDLADEAFESDFRKYAFENKLMPDQAKAMYDFVSNQAGERSESIQSGQNEAQENAMLALKESWGDGFDQELRTAKLAVKEFGGDDFIEYLNDSGLGNDTQIIKFMNKLGKQFFKEDSYSEESRPAYALSPDDAKAKAGAIMGDLNGPYYNKAHPDHNRVVSEVNKMYQVMNSVKEA